MVLGYRIGDLSSKRRFVSKRYLVVDLGVEHSDSFDKVGHINRALSNAL